MARQRKILPARRRQAMDDSVLIRSAESLGRMIGSLQRQLDAARRLTLPADNAVRGNGHAPGQERADSSGKRKTTLAAKKTVASGAKAATKKKPARRPSTAKRGGSKPAL